MNTYVTSQRVLRAAVRDGRRRGIAVVESHRGGEATVLAPLERGEADALVSELARCRTVLSDDATALDACRRIWAENRRHFFASTGSRQLPDPPATEVPAERTKTEERIPPAEIQQNRSR